MQATTQTTTTESQSDNNLPVAQAVKREKRQVSVSRTENYIIIGFSWMEWAGDTCLGMKNKLFEYPKETDLTSVLQALHIFMHGDEELFFISGFAVAVSGFLDSSPEKFDLVSNSEEPAQTFVSRYILQ